MKLRIATFNVENLFTRPSAMADGSGSAGQAAIDHHAEFNSIIDKLSYTGDDKERLIELDTIYRFSTLNPPANALVAISTTSRRARRWRHSLPTVSSMCRIILRIRQTGPAPTTPATPLTSSTISSCHPRCAPH